MEKPRNGRTALGVEARRQRLVKLQQYVDANGPVPVKIAAHRLDVSEMTVRRDLASAVGSLKALGGYIVSTLTPSTDKYTLDEAGDQQAASKRLASSLAVASVQANECVFVDCGSTMAHLVESLPAELPLTLVCYSSNIAALASRRANTQLILLGGLFHASSASFFSEEALTYLRRLGVNKAFLSAGGIHPDRGASCSNFHEVAVKQAAIACAAESFLVIDESKLGRLRPAFFSPLSSFAKIFVGGTSTAGIRRQFKDAPLEYARAASS